MKIEVLASVMNQTDYSIVEKMNLNTNAIIINQSNDVKFNEFFYKNSKIRFFTFNERGVGLSRNNAILRAEADILLFADEDIEYVNNYDQIVINAFLENPDVDMILFNVPSKNINRPTYIINKKSRVHFYNCLRYGAVKIAIKRKSLVKKNVYFSPLFGGGAKYSAGEDSLFIAECIKHKMKVITNPSIIGYVSQESSSWYQGFNDKYFIDKGVFFYYLNHKFSIFFGIYYIIKHMSKFQVDKDLFSAFKLILRGIKIAKKD